MTKEVWIFGEKQFDNEDDARSAVGERAKECVEYELSDFVEWFNDEYGSISMGWYYEFNAYEVAEAMSVDFGDFLESYADYLYENEVYEDEVEVECDYIFNDVTYDSYDDAVVAIYDYAKGGAFADTIDSDGSIRIGYGEAGAEFSRSEILYKLNEAAYWEMFAEYCEELKAQIEEVEREVTE